MNYRKIYDSLIERGKNRKLEGYKESHHIIPKCLGGKDTKDNLVELTPEEHYLAHQLLVKIYPNEPKLIYAAQMMIPNRPSNKMYGWIRRKYSKAVSKNQLGKGNSQSGTFWVSNIDLRKNLKLKKGEEIPCGYKIGRNLWSKIDKLNLLNKRKEEKENNNIKKAKKYYLLFLESDYNSLRKFADSDLYPHSHVSLRNLWFKYLPEYKNVKHGKNLKQSGVAD